MYFSGTECILEHKHDHLGWDTAPWLPWKRETKPRYSDCLNTRAHTRTQTLTGAAELVALDLCNAFVGEAAGAGTASATSFDGVWTQEVCQPLHITVTHKGVLGQVADGKSWGDISQIRLNAEELRTAKNSTRGCFLTVSGCCAESWRCLWPDSGSYCHTATAEPSSPSHWTAPLWCSGSCWHSATWEHQHDALLTKTEETHRSVWKDLTNYTHSINIRTHQYGLTAAPKRPDHQTLHWEARWSYYRKEPCTQRATGFP